MKSTLYINMHFSKPDSTLILKGFVVDATDKSPLPGAVVKIRGHDIGANTDTDGYYIIKSNVVAACTVEVKALGYITLSKLIAVENVLRMDFELSRDTSRNGMGDVSTRTMIKPDRTSSTHIWYGEEIEKMPGN